MISIYPIQAFNDNYIWLLVEPNQQYAAVVDPGDADPVLDRLAQTKLTLCAVLITHHHQDHTGGVKALKEKLGVPVYGPANEAIPSCDHLLNDGDCITIEQLNTQFTILDIPGHTKGHIAYYSAPNLFCGDTLFAAGCGRLFEGTAKQMLLSLAKLAALPDNTQVYCAHEYTLNNLRFAQQVEPSNAAIAKRLKKTQLLRKQNQITLPSTIAWEKQTNPFLRVHLNSVQKAASEFSKQACQDPLTAFTVIRRWKDQF